MSKTTIHAKLQCLKGYKAQLHQNTATPTDERPGKKKYAKLRITEVEED